MILFIARSAFSYDGARKIAPCRDLAIPPDASGGRSDAIALCYRRHVDRRSLSLMTGGAQTLDILQAVVMGEFRWGDVIESELADYQNGAATLAMSVCTLPSGHLGFLSEFNAHGRRHRRRISRRAWCLRRTSTRLARPLPLWSFCSSDGPMETSFCRRALAAPRPCTQAPA